MQIKSCSLTKHISKCLVPKIVIKDNCVVILPQAVSYRAGVLKLVIVRSLANLHAIPSSLRLRTLIGK